MRSAAGAAACEAPRARRHAKRRGRGAVTELPSSGGGERLAADSGVPFLGRIPLVPGLARDCDAGVPFVAAHPDSAMGRHLFDVLRPIVELAGPSCRAS